MTPTLLALAVVAVLGSTDSRARADSGCTVSSARGTTVQTITCDFLNVRTYRDSVIGGGGPQITAASLKVGEAKWTNCSGSGTHVACAVPLLLVVTMDRPLTPKGP